MNEKPWFSGTKNALAWWIYLADRRPHNWKSNCVMTDDIQHRSAVLLNLDPSKHAFLMLPVGLGCFYSKEWCC
jgi:hypothetical protein